MGLPKLTIKLFPPKPGKAYASSGNLSIAISDVHAFAEWLLGQHGEHDAYLQQTVVRLLAFEYNNTSKGGNTYRTIQLRDPADLEGPQAPASAGRGNRSYSSPPPGWTPRPDEGCGGFDDGEIPF
jgi:hypothetical protein